MLSNQLDVLICSMGRWWVWAEPSWTLLTWRQRAAWPGRKRRKWRVGRARQVSQMPEPRHRACCCGKVIHSSIHQIFHSVAGTVLHTSPAAAASPCDAACKHSLLWLMRPRHLHPNRGMHAMATAIAPCAASSPMSSTGAQRRHLVHSVLHNSSFVLVKAPVAAA